MISKNEIKLITGLHQKKYRNKHGLFIAEGPKIIQDLLAAGLELYAYFATEDASAISKEFERITPAELKKISALATPNTQLAVFNIPKPQSIQDTGLTVVLDAVRDPGNLGTIIRLCDWFGVTQVVCSPDTVDCYNPKVVQATMGSIARVDVHYCELSEFLNTSHVPKYAAVMDGTSVYEESLPGDAILIMGNEANGISSEVQSTVTHEITIPHFGNPDTAESLNVATATGILLNEFRRSTGK
ncbi:MAG: RNA methyltransferase [Flavobacteriaceae bacterium]|nr:RNA methyltransferase [Flavobacteriaceae bacterium]